MSAEIPLSAKESGIRHVRGAFKSHSNSNIDSKVTIMPSAFGGVQATQEILVGSGKRQRRLKVPGLYRPVKP